MHCVSKNGWKIYINKKVCDPYPCQYQRDVYVRLSSYFLQIVIASLVLRISTWFFQESSLGYSNTYSFGKMYKTYHFVCFFNFLANVQISPRQFCLFLGLGWCLRSADALGPCNWPVFFWGSKNLVDLGNLKKKSTKSDHVYYTLKLFENFMFLEDENVPLVLGGLH
jgi:hypothetical protein